MESDVTVVVPTRDRAALLRQTLLSVKKQTFAPAEIIVADDGSRDETATVAQDFSCRRIHNPHGSWGASGARNAGLEHVRTPFVFFLDSDDLLLPGALTALRSRLLSEPASPFVFGRALIARLVDGRWRPEGLIAPTSSELASLPSALFARNFVPSCGALVRTQAARAVGGFPSSAETSNNEDFYFWVYLSLRGVPAYEPTIVSVYRVHAGNRFVASAGLDYELVDRIGRTHDALAPGLATHFGGRLCEHMIDAVHRRDALSLVSGAARILRLTPSRFWTLKAAARHVRTRRSFARAGTDAWKVFPDLGGWLETYAATEVSEREAGAGLSRSM